MKKSLVLAVKLFVICAVAGALLAFTNSATAPVIAERKAAEAQAAYAAVYPGAEEIVMLEDDALLTENITEIAEVKAGGATDGYIFNVLTPAGYGGPINFAVGVKADGAVQGFEVLSMTETQGFGAAVAEQAYADGTQGVMLNAPVIANGAGGQATEIPAITGATMTTRAMTAGFNAVVEKLAELTGNQVDMNAVPEKAEPVAAINATEEVEVNGTAGTKYTIESPNGFGGPIVFDITLAEDGTILAFEIIKSDETEGYGAKASEASYAESVIGKNVADGPEAVSGATFTTEALQTGFKAAADPSSAAAPSENKEEKSESTDAEASTGTKLEEVSAEALSAFYGSEVVALEGATMEKGVEAIFQGAVNGEDATIYQVKSPEGFHDYIRFVVAVKADGTVLDFQVVKHSETEGFGAKIEEKEYADSIIGQPIDKGPDAIAGATFTSEAMAEAFAAVAKTHAALQ